MKKILSTFAIATLIGVLTLGSSLGAFARHNGQAYKNISRTSTSYSNTNRSYDGLTEKEMEDFIDKRVESGDLTQKEADALKDDITSMRDYCNNYYYGSDDRTTSGSGYGRNCCRYR